MTTHHRKGRGAVSDRDGRFASRPVEYDPEEAHERSQSAPGTELRAMCTGRIIATNSSPDVPFDRSINPYQGCEHGCIYCYARPSHSYLDLSPGLDFETQIFYKPNAAAALVAEWQKPSYVCKPIAIGANTDPYQPAEKTLGITCMFMWIILAALCFGAVFDGLGAVKAIEGFFVERLGLGPWQILIMMQLSYILMGMFLDDTAMLVIVAPLYVPLVKVLGFDLVWYGVLYTITCQIAYMTPPFGYNLFLMRAMAPPEITLGDIYRSIIPFVLVMVVGLALVMIFPQIALWLPQWHYGR